MEYDQRWGSLDPLGWSRNDYERTEDPWNGDRDFARTPRGTVRTGRGDREDCALVAPSWAVARGRSGVGVGFRWELPFRWPRHVLAVDDERVHSSGVVSRERVDEWAADSRDDVALRRRVTPTGSGRH